MNLTLPLLLATGTLLAIAAPAASAQRGLSGTSYDALPFPQTNLYPTGMGLGSGRTTESAGSRPAILLTGYWPVTNEMVRHFSTDPVLNPGGWQGSNWEGRGYDVYSYFAEFPGGGGQGMGDLEVDYQDTSADFWPIADALRPIAVITFSRGVLDRRFELEWNNRNLTTWINDYTVPQQPTPSPPDNSYPADGVRNSTLPVQDVLAALRVANLDNFGVHVDQTGNGGGYLSEFIGYHGVWYQALHSSPTDPAWCVTAGHIHVGGLLGKPKAVKATHQTLRAVMRYVDDVTGATAGDTAWFCKTSVNSAGRGAILTAIGSNSISQNDLNLNVVSNVPNTFGLAFYGSGTQAPTPLGDGNLCVTAPHFRVLPAVAATSEGTSNVLLDFTQPPLSAGPGQVSAGSTWHFQFWLRDMAAGQTGFTASSGLSLTFAP